MSKQTEVRTAQGISDLNDHNYRLQIEKERLKTQITELEEYIEELRLTLQTNEDESKKELQNNQIKITALQHQVRHHQLKDVKLIALITIFSSGPLWRKSKRGKLR